MAATNKNILSIIFIKFKEDDTKSYPYFCKEGHKLQSDKIYLVGDNGKSIPVFVELKFAFPGGVEELNKADISFLQRIKDIKKYIEVLDFNRIKLIDLPNTEFMDNIRKRCLIKVEYYEDFEKLTEDEKKLYNEAEIDIMKDRSNNRKASEEFYTNRYQEEDQLKAKLNLIENTIIDCELGDPKINLLYQQREVIINKLKERK